MNFVQLILPIPAGIFEKQGGFEFNKKPRREEIRQEMPKIPLGACARPLKARGRKTAGQRTNGGQSAEFMMREFAFASLGRISKLRYLRFGCAREAPSQKMKENDDNPSVLWRRDFLLRVLLGVRPSRGVGRGLPLIGLGMRTLFTAFKEFASAVLLKKPCFEINRTKNHSPFHRPCRARRLGMDAVSSLTGATN